jgi:hypothetical protein
MFQFMRNTHLVLGLLFVAMVLVFALSSMVIIYRPWMPTDDAEPIERVVAVAPEAASSPRSLALELMRSHDLKGTLGPIEEDAEAIKFRIFRPGTEVRVEYNRASGEALLKTRRWGALQMLVQLHVNHGFWHDDGPANAWAAFSLLTSIGMLLLGVSGIYLWFMHHQERLIGGVLLGVGFGYAIVTLTLIRLA